MIEIGVSKIIIDNITILPFLILGIVFLVIAFDSWGCNEFEFFFLICGVLFLILYLLLFLEVIGIFRLVLTQ